MVKRRNFTPDEDAFIRQHYYTMPCRIISQHLNRQIKSIYKRAGKIGLESKKPVRRWTIEEDEVIRNRGTATVSEVANRLERDITEVYDRARKLGCSFRPDRRTTSRGYERIRVDTEVGKRTVWEHRYVMEQLLGRPLQKEEIVHHINGNKRDNRADNLYLCETPRKHKLAHDSLAEIVEILVANGTIYFDREKGVYKLCGTGTSKHKPV